MLIQLLLICNGFLVVGVEHCPELAEARSHFIESLPEEALTGILDQIEASTCPQVKGYRAALYMRQAEFALNPYKKWRLFKTGRDDLEQVIAQFPEDVELRFIRYLTQANVPGFLGYSKNIEEDKAFIEANLYLSDISTDFQAIVTKHLE